MTQIVSIVICRGFYNLTEEGGPGKFIEVNDIACCRLGYTRKQLLKMSRLDIACLSKDDSVPTLTKDLLTKKTLCLNRF